jgi:hypothetical protein
MWTRATLFLALLVSACWGAHPQPEPERALRQRVGPYRAAVYEIADQYTHAVGAAYALEQVGFEVRTINPAEPVPTDIDLLCIGSFASEDGAAYDNWVAANTDRVIEWMARGGTVVQFTQADQREADAPFVPAPLAATRDDLDASPVYMLRPDHLLLENLPRAVGCNGTPTIDLPYHIARQGSWETYVSQQGFGVILAVDELGARPALMEAAVAQGRIVLSSLYFDKLVDTDGTPVGDADFRNTAGQFFANLHRYVRLVRAGAAPLVVPTDSDDTPDVLPYVPGSITLVALPDTQIYAENYPQHFHAQTSWIVDNLFDRNIAAVFHEGDITNRNTPAQWQVAKEAMDRLFGLVPCIIAPGNHDFGDGGSSNTRTTLMNDYFEYSRWRFNPGFGRTFEPGRMENNYSLMQLGGLKFIGIALEWSPRDAVLEWADALLKAHPDRIGIIVTHAYMYFDDTRYDWETRGTSQSWNPHSYGTANDPGGCNDGEEIWNAIRGNPNLGFALSGHVLGDGAGRCSATADPGNLVHQMLANYQMRTEGGQGYLRLIEILPDHVSIQVKTYSPVLDAYMTDPQHQFTLQLDVQLQE